MEFCEKCGSMMRPTTDDDGNRVLKCPSCSHTIEIGKRKMSVSQDVDRTPRDKIVVVEDDSIPMPVTAASCPKCEHNEAYYWTVQTRRGDEGATEFYRCTKCKHTWRNYGGYTRCFPTVDLLSDSYRNTIDGAPILTEEKQYPRTPHAPLMRVRNLSADISGHVRIMGIVLKSDPGSALIQDIYDDVDKAKSLWVIVEGTLEPEERYLLIGTVIERKTSSGKEIRLNVSIAHNINSLDISQYKEALELEEKVVRAMSK